MTPSRHNLERLQTANSGGAQPDTNGPLIALRSLGFSYQPESKVLHELELEILEGEFVSVVGRSGCGKTTLLHLLIGLLTPTRGVLECHATEVALVFQKPHLLPWRTSLQNAAYGLECRGVTAAEAQARARPLLESMKLGHALDALPHQLSEGMKQRVNLCRALLVQPQLLLLDEPFSALDSITKAELQQDLLQTWQREKLTIVFVSHSLEEVVELSDRVVILGGSPTRVQTTERVQLPRPRTISAETWSAVRSLQKRLEVHSA